MTRKPKPIPTKPKLRTNLKAGAKASAFNPHAGDYHPE